MTALDENIEWLGTVRSEGVHAALGRVGGFRAVPETVQHTDEGAGTVDVNGNKSVTASVFAWPWACLGRPFNRTQPTMLSHCVESTSTSR